MLMLMLVSLHCCLVLAAAYSKNGLQGTTNCQAVTSHVQHCHVAVM